MTSGKHLIRLAVMALLLLAHAPARADSARIAGLQDVSFGSLTSGTDQSISQSVVVCSYKNNPQRLPYSVTARGSGAGGAFTISSGAATLPYEVQWSDAPAQSGGVMLQAGVTRPGFANGATGFACPGQPDTASLTVSIRSANLVNAQAGAYTGSLQLLIAPE